MSGNTSGVEAPNPPSPADRLIPFIAHGAIDEIDAARGCLSIAPPTRPGPADAGLPRRPGLPMVDPAPVLVSLLEELQVEAVVLECSLLPSSDQYGIVVQDTQKGRQAVLVPRLVLERALVDPDARARVRDLLRSAVEALRRPAVNGNTRLTAYPAALDVRSLPGPRCGRCEGPILADDMVLIREGRRRWHLACPLTR